MTANLQIVSDEAHLSANSIGVSPGFRVWGSRYQTSQTTAHDVIKRIKCMVKDCLSHTQNCSICATYLLLKELHGTFQSKRKQRTKGRSRNTYFLLFQKASTNILLYLIAIGHTVQSSSKAPCTWTLNNVKGNQYTYVFLTDLHKSNLVQLLSYTRN